MKSSILRAVFFAVFLLQTVLSENRTNIDVHGYYMLNITSMGQAYDCDFYANMTVHEHSTFIFNSYNFHSYGGSTFINKGIFYSQNLGAYPWYDPTHNSGSSFKLNEGQTTGGIHNTGFFMYNDNTTNCGPPTYTIHGNFFINEGTFILAGCQACDGSTNIIKPYGTNAIFHNTGILAYMQYFMTVGDAPSTYWGSDSACTTSGVATVINNGSLCLFNNNPVYQGSQYAGNGCIDIGNQSTFFMRCAQLFGLDGNLQTFYLSTNTSVLYFDNIGVSNAPATPYLVSGWGNNNQITIHISDPVWNYDGKTLSITAASVTYQFIIGPGYDSSLISWSQGPSGNNLRAGGARFVYNAPPPDSSRPSVCLPCPTVIPKLYDILQDQPDYTTTFTTTKSDGSVETDSGVVHVTNTDGTITTTTSLFPNEYTTTFTTTESDGFVATDSGIVFATTDKDEYIALDEDVVKLQELDGPTFEMTGGDITVNGLYLEADKTNGIYLGDTPFGGWSIVDDPILSLKGFGTEFYICPEEEVPLQLISIDCNCFVGELHVSEDAPTSITNGATVAYVASECNAETISISIAIGTSSEPSPTATSSTATPTVATITTTYISNEVITITDCPETVTDCPLNSIRTTTIIHTLTTTYCPESGVTSVETGTTSDTYTTPIVNSNSVGEVSTECDSNTNNESTIVNNSQTSTDSTVANNAPTNTVITTSEAHSSINSVASSSTLPSPTPSVSVDESGASRKKWKIISSLLASVILLVFG
ncbi:uncharacterized protein RJT21DRAFT_115414 [Scheffersomyces amazonensis]|uniref:uncharacterized protein n=1 Tax=Scheffersomyces amazonensis TaxID=1078765 RepID=UPI00315D8E14